MSFFTEIRPGDVRENRQVDALLQQEGIRRDANLDYTCGLFDEDWRLIATGSCFGSTIRCLAVSGDHQGEGLLNQVVSHLAEIQAQRGNTHLFLYTKPQSAKFFGDLNFHEIARVEGSLVFMENRPQGFRRYCAGLEAARRPGKAAAIVMNANPFTLGHLHLAERAAAENGTVYLFVLSEEAGPIPFAVRRRLVREGVSRLSNVVCLDSGPYMISSATFPSYFLRDEDTVIRTHAALDLAVFRRIASCLDIEVRYVGEEPASHVTALYNQAMIRYLPEAGIRCQVVPRLETGGRIVSASAVRQAVHDGDLDRVRDMLPPSTLRFFESPEAAPVIRAIQAERDVIHY